MTPSPSRTLSQAAGTHQAPPERVSVGVEVVVLPLLRQVHQKRGQDEAQEADVPGSDQLLESWPRQRTGPASSPARPPRETLSRAGSFPATAPSLRQATGV